MSLPKLQHSRELFWRAGWSLAKAGPACIFVSECSSPISETKTPMALHRDIYWVGRQWAVTGHGIQACNQKQKSQFDIAGSRLWEDGVQEAIRAETWVNADDFEKAIDVARKYYPEPPRKAPPPVEVASPPPEPFLLLEPQPDPCLLMFDLQVEGHGKLMPVWRIRTPVAARPDNRPAE